MNDVSFTEIHFHVLPGLDDGPATIDDSVSLARAAAAQGTSTIVATPHVNHRHLPDVGILPERVRQLQLELVRERVPIAIRIGAELSHERASGLSQAELELIAQGPSGRRWVLLEAPLTGLEAGFTTAADDLRARGFAVVVAHPERALAVPGSGWEIIERELRAGSRMQVNAWSVAGLYGLAVRAHARRILACASDAVIASDAHGPERMPALELALGALVHAGDANAVRRMTALPRALVERGLSTPAKAAA